MSSKTITIHIGPHKTGTTSIQHALSTNEAGLSAAGTIFMHNELTHNASMLLSQESFDEAEEVLNRIRSLISQSPVNNFIISQEDFCGDLPGRTRKKAIYPRLAKNLRIVQRALSPHIVKFVFFYRERDEWLRSCYHQHLKYRTFFSNFEEFETYYGDAADLQRKMSRCIELFGDAFVIIPYSKEQGKGLEGVLAAAGISSLSLMPALAAKNTSPTPEKIRILERINKLSDFKSTAWFAKKLALEGWFPRRPELTMLAAGMSVVPAQARMAFPELCLRAGGRFSRQSVEDILPDRDVDLDDMAFDILPRNVDLPDIPRIHMSDQSRILDYHLRGKSKLAKLNAISISYLRRNTDYTSKARYLFHRIWFEKGAILINELSTRWLISTLQTFLDHGENEAQRMIGCCGYFYANLMKIYEGERSIEGLEQDAVYVGLTPSTKNMFAGLDRFSVGGTDLLLNTNALALDLSMRDDVAGLVLQEFLLRVQHSANAFTRMDRTRHHNNVEVSNFEDTWSFFVRPK